MRARGIPNAPCNTFIRDVPNHQDAFSSRSAVSMRERSKRSSREVKKQCRRTRMLQSAVSELGPVQPMSPKFPLSQVRVLVVRPPPQVASHSLHGLHGDQLGQSCGWKCSMCLRFRGNSSHKQWWTWGWGRSKTKKGAL